MCIRDSSPVVPVLDVLCVIRSMIDTHLRPGIAATRGGGGAAADAGAPNLSGGVVTSVAGAVTSSSSDEKKACIAGSPSIQSFFYSRAEPVAMLVRGGTTGGMHAALMKFVSLGPLRVLGEEGLNLK